MASLFSKDPAARPPVPRYGKERIQQEIEHLKNRSSVRTAQEKKRSLAQFISCAVVFAFLGLYFMDPFLYAYHKNSAIKTYLYLHSYGSEQKAGALAATGILSETEVHDLNRKQGAFQDYFSTPQRAEEAANSTIDFMNGLQALRLGQYEHLNPIGKLRYILFVRFGLPPPRYWDALNPSPSLEN